MREQDPLKSENFLIVCVKMTVHSLFREMCSSGQIAIGLKRQSSIAIICFLNVLLPGIVDLSHYKGENLMYIVGPGIRNGLRPNCYSVFHAVSIISYMYVYKCTPVYFVRLSSQQLIETSCI